MPANALSSPSGVANLRQIWANCDFFIRKGLKYDTVAYIKHSSIHGMAPTATANRVSNLFSTVLGDNRMNKKIVALAVAAAFTIPAAASAQVTLFGTLEQEVVHNSGNFFEDRNDGKSGFFVTDGQIGTSWNNGAGPTTIGIRATHDLGNGMTALGVATFNPLAGYGDRDLYVGLNMGAPGTILVGRLTTPFATSGKDPFHGTFMQARGNGGMLGTAGNLGNGGHLRNVVAYTNSFGPLSFVGGIVLDEGPVGDPNAGLGSEAGSNNHAFALRLNYDIGDGDVWFAYTQADDYQNAAFQATNDPEADINLRGMKLGAEYKFGDFRVMGQWERVENLQALDIGIANLLDGDTGLINMDIEDGKADFYLLSGSYTLGANVITLNLGQHSDNGDADSTRYVALGVMHNLSPRVRVHAGYRMTDNRADRGRDEETGDRDASGGGSVHAIGAGMRVTF